MICRRYVKDIIVLIQNYQFVTDLTLRCLVETLDHADSLSSEPPSKRQCGESGSALCSDYNESRETSSTDKDLKRNVNR